MAMEKPEPNFVNSLIAVRRFAASSDMDLSFLNVKYA
jgi:hypothetical protein